MDTRLTEDIDAALRAEDIRHRKEYRQRPEVKARHNANKRERYPSQSAMLAERNKRYRESPKGKAYQQEFSQREKRKADRRKHNLKKNYGITLDQWNALLHAQNHCCAICGSDSPGGRFGVWHTDHDHEEGWVRGILCALCNVGRLRLEFETVLAALAYLRDPPAYRIIGRIRAKKYEEVKTA